MQAIVFHGVGDIRLDEVPDPKIKEPNDAIVRITASAICGTDLHFVRGTVTDMDPGTILGHEGVGIVEELGKDVRNFSVGDRVVIASTIACGYCSYCRDGYYAQCDNANPNGKQAGTAYFGGPRSSGSFSGMQAEKVRVPFANVGMVKLPDQVTDEQAIMLADIFPTGYFGAENAEIKDGDVVAVYGCGPVGLFAIISAKLLNAGRVIAVDRLPDRLEMARKLGAEVINFDEEDPVETILRITGGIGADRVIDAVGVDAEQAEHGQAAWKAREQRKKFAEEVKKVAPETKPDQGNWEPGNAPSQALIWAIDSIAKAGTLSIIGVYPETLDHFPLGKAMHKNLTINMGNCNHRAYIPMLLALIESGVVDPTEVLTKQTHFESAIEAFKAFDKREAGWVKVALEVEPA